MKSILYSIIVFIASFVAAHASSPVAAIQPGVYLFDAGPLSEYRDLTSLEKFVTDIMTEKLGMYAYAQNPVIAQTDIKYGDYTNYFVLIVAKDNSLRAKIYRNGTEIHPLTDGKKLHSMDDVREVFKTLH